MLMEVETFHISFQALLSGIYPFHSTKPEKRWCFSGL